MNVVKELEKDMSRSAIAKRFSLQLMPGRLAFGIVPMERVRINDKSKIILLYQKPRPDETMEERLTKLEKAYKDHPEQGVVVAVGQDFDRGKDYVERMFVRPGDIILYKLKPYDAVLFEGMAFLVGTQADVIAIHGRDKDFNLLEKE